MATEKRPDLIDRKDLIAAVEKKRFAIADNTHPYEAIRIQGKYFREVVDSAPTVDAVPVDKIIFHHILIDKNGIPEVKLQFGDRTMVLRRENDPVNVVEVVRCKDCFADGCCSVQIDLDMGSEGYCPKGKKEK